MRPVRSAPIRHAARLSNPIVTAPQGVRAAANAVRSGLSGRRPRLLAIVFCVSLGLLGLTASVLVLVVSDHIRESAIDSSVTADGALIRSFAAQVGAGGDLGAPAPPDRTAAINAGLASLIDPDGSGIVQLKIYSADDMIRFSNDPALVGRPSGDDDDLAQAIYTARPVAGIQPADGAEESTVARSGNVLEEYLPIFRDGQVTAVFEVYRDAAPIIAHVDETRADVLRVTIVATLVLAILLYFIFRAANRRLSQQTSDLLESERRDALTGLLNHGSIVAELIHQLEMARPAEGGGDPDGRTVGVSIVDVDNFRLINEVHGHVAGDLALRQVAEILRRELSYATFLGRYGPDEFLLVAPQECIHDLEPAIVRLRTALVDLSLQFGVSERLPVTVSAGICYAPADGDAATELLSVATVTLGEAKASGGDAIRVAASLESLGRPAEVTSFDVLQGLVIAVDTKDRYTKRHSEDVARYALFIADRIGLDPDLRRTLGMSGLLHDVGKIGIPDTILRKPAALTTEEYSIVKQHVALGDTIVRDLPNLDLVRGGVRHHHERWDGRGYLTGLAGEEIPLLARILAVADAFSAMTTTRPYRKALAVEEAIRRLEDAADSQLDPRLVVAFVEGLRVVPDAPLPGTDRPLPLIWTPRVSVA
jgi:diguanylate cyclase (GGDEF)-like protein